MTKTGREGAPDGAANGNAKLTAAKVRKLRREWATGKYTQLELAHKYGISRFQVCRIVTRKSWAHI